ncbi:MAG TPA: hypothetical protein VFP20_07665 [Bacteroidales bacterium]|nr:hypothetical protein [Bacteroidales bacterium]
MKKALISWIVLALFYTDVSVGQSLTISPLSPSPSNLYILAPSEAGNKPNDPLLSYMGQQITYMFPTGWGNIGFVEVNSTTIPTGLSFIIQASMGLGGTEGISTNPVTVTSTYQPIITSIAKVKKYIIRDLTQSLVISDFSQLHPGQYTVTINLWLH